MFLKLASSAEAKETEKNRSIDFFSQLIQIFDLLFSDSGLYWRPSSWLIRFYYHVQSRNQVFGLLYQ